MQFPVKNKPIQLTSVAMLHSEFQLPYMLGGFLSARGINDVETALDYLEKDRPLSEPNVLPDMKKAVDRIAGAISTKEKIYVVGDFDCDGILSSSIMIRILKKLGANFSYLLPEQQAGHGINHEILDKVKRAGGKLIITVDNGTSSLSEIASANSAGIDVIVSDHHEPDPSGLPSAFALINPKTVPDNKMTYLCGAGIAFYIARALSLKINGDESAITNDLHVLAAIGTIGDVAPLILDNRSIVKSGLSKIGNSEIAGLSLLMDKIPMKAPVSSRDIAFRIVPVFNAAGKFGLVDDAVKLATDSNYMLLSGIVQRLLSLNDNRREGVASILPALAEQAKKQVDSGALIIVVSGPHNSAYSGLLANKLAEKFSKPAVVISTTGNTCRASSRSANGFSVLAMLDSCKEFHEGGGGHAMAAGFSIKKDCIDKFTFEVNEYAKKQLVNIAASKVWLIDGELNAADLTPDFFNWLKVMEPFGQKNEAPFLKVRGLILSKRTYATYSYYSCNLNGVDARIYLNSDPSVEVPTNTQVNVIAEVRMQRGEPLLVISDIELAAAGVVNE
jgi:single-stranded-DNA-specific exonuclease